MTLAARRSAIVADLCRMSRGGWQNARPCDYEPLERELRELEAAPRKIIQATVRLGVDSTSRRG